MTEKDIINLAKIDFSSRGGRIWRTAPGLLWKGKLQHEGLNSVTLYAPTPMRLFPVGEPDCHFYEQVVITPDMVGKTVLLFGKAEVKTDAYKKLTKAQENNLEVVKRKGGKALIIRESAFRYIVEEV